jgi:hypothetical protein
MLPAEVVDAYNSTCLIPIRLAWNTRNDRGGCAIAAVAQHRGVSLDEVRNEFPTRYEEGFLYAWDAEEPRREFYIDKIKKEDDEMVTRGFCDGLLCRSAVESAYSSALIPITATDTKES